MFKAADLLRLIAEDFIKSSLSTHEKTIKKYGMRVHKFGKGATIFNPKTKKKVIMQDTGRDIIVKKYSNNKKVEKDKRMRGSPEDIVKEIEWASR